MEEGICGAEPSDSCSEQIQPTIYQLGFIVEGTKIE